MRQAVEIESAAPAPWSGVTLVDLFVSTANLNGQALAFAEPLTSGGRVTRRTYAEAAETVDNLLQRIEEIGLDPGSRIALAMGGSVESPLALLAVLKAGMVPCLLPPWLPAGDLSKALGDSGAEAVVTVAALGALKPAEIMRAACAMDDGPRFILAFGDRLPAGVVPLSDAMAQGGSSDFFNVFDASRSRPTPVLTLSRGPTGPLWIEHDQEALIARGLGVVTRANLGSAEAILSTLAPLSAAALATGLVPALLTGATLHLHGVFESAKLLDQLAMMSKPHLVAPAALERALLQADLLGGPAVSSTLLLHRPPARMDQRERARRQDSPVIDLLALGEKGLAIGQRDARGVPDLSCAPLRVPDSVDGALVLEMKLDQGRLLLRGEGVSGRPPGSTALNWADAQLTARLDGDRLVAVEPSASAR